MDYNRAMTGFTKLFSGIVHSTVWREEMHVKVVWITMLALSDRKGRVLVSMPGLADAARVTIDQCRDALEHLSSPDEFSRTKEHEGRRIEEIDGGWQLLNYLKYRELRDDDERRMKVREAVAKHRARQPKSESVTVITGKHIAEAEAYAEAHAEAEGEKHTPLSLASLLFSEIRENNPNAIEPDIDRWAEEIDRAIRLDNRDPSELARLIRWSQRDTFWRGNILSAASLRKQFDRLFVQSKGKSNLKLPAFDPDEFKGDER